MGYSIKMDERNGMYDVDGITGYFVHEMNYATVRKVMTTFYINCGLQSAYMNFRFLPNTIKKLSKVNTEIVVCLVRSLAGQLLTPVPAAFPPCPTAPCYSCSGHTGGPGVCLLGRSDGTSPVLTGWPFSDLET